MNTMADGARDRLVAQIGEALFGQPGLTLMELAEKVKESRSNASPLGYVRVEAIKALREDDEVTGVMVHVDERTDSVPVYLSAQPSPGGQDALDCIGRIEEAIEFRVPHDIYAAVHGELAELKAALAARQPVELIAQKIGDYRVTVAEDAITVSRGRDIVFAYSADDPEPIMDRQPVGQEPVAHEYTFAGLGKRDSVAFVGPEYKPAAPKGMQLVAVRPLYRQPAQAVDLGQFREAVYEAWRSSEAGSEAEGKINHLLALIDSHAVGK